MARTRMPPTADELRARATARGYKRGTYKEKDKIRKKGIHNSTTVKNQDATLRRYVLWTLLELRDTAAQQGSALPDEETAREHCLRPEIAAPDLSTVTDFMRFYAATSDPRLDEEISTVDSLNSVAEWFFAGFARVTKTEIVEEDRKEVYHFVRTTLVDEGLAVNRHRPKYNFTERSHTRLQGTLWTTDDLMFIPERYRVQTTFSDNVYCWTGARLSAFFTGGLRYGDTEIVLQRSKGARPWTATWRLDQRWVKNNRDPKNIVFGSAHKEHNKFIYNETGFLLVMAIADGALLGINSIEDLLKKQIPRGQDVLHLRYNASALEKPILRKCTRDGGVTDEPMPKSAFLAIWRSNCSNAGYYQIPTIHALRRGLGIKVEKNYTPVQRSQHITQADLRVYGQSYLANCSSVDGQAAFLGELSDHRHIEYFQSIDQFWEPGLPHELPARVDEGLSRDSRLLELQEQVAILDRQGTPGPAVREARRLVSNYRRTLHRKALRNFQRKWVSDRRDWKVLTDGRERPDDNTNTDLVQHLCLFIPERGRLARWMCQEEPLSPESMWQALSDLQSLCTRDLTVLYLPGLNPQEGRCPVDLCHKSMDELPKNRRNYHIQTCTRNHMAKKLLQLPSHIHYCHLCFTWVAGEDEWESHCASHLSSLATKRCGTLSYGYTLVRPGYSPFRLGDTKLFAAQRLQSWTRDFDLWKDVNEQLEGRRWPLACPHPLCDTRLKDEHDLQFHFIDDHSFSRTRPNRPASTTCSGSRACDQAQNPRGQSPLPGPKRKRKAASGDEVLQYTFVEAAPPSVCRQRESDPPLPKKARVMSSTISPSLLSIVDLTGVSPEDDVDTSLPSAAGNWSIFHHHSSGVESAPLALRPQNHRPDDTRPRAERSTTSESADVFDDVFSPLESSRSSSIPSRSGSDPCRGEGKASGQVWESTSSSDVLDNDSDLDALFDQYIRPHSPSPPPAPSSSPLHDAASELSGSTMVDGPLNTSHANADCNAGRLGYATTENMLDGGWAPDQGDISHVGDGMRLRLRVSQPKIILRLKLPATVQAGRKKSEGGKRRNTRARGTEQGKAKETTKKATKREKAKKGTRSEKAMKGRKRTR